jgi:hypothetical protein
MIILLIVQLPAHNAYSDAAQANRFSNRILLLIIPKSRPYARPRFVVFTVLADAKSCWTRSLCDEKVF